MALTASGEGSARANDGGLGKLFQGLKDIIKQSKWSRCQTGVGQLSKIHHLHEEIIFASPSLSGHQQAG